MSNGPLPSTLILLTDLSSTPSGSKVRFLGCVTDYSTQTGCLRLQHHYTWSPTSGNVTAAPVITAIVNVNLLVESLKTTDTQIGEWVNVIGYVDSAAGVRDCTNRQTEKGEIQKTIEVPVQALMLWSAANINLAEYEKAVVGRKKSGN